MQIISEGKQLFPSLPFLQGISINSCLLGTALRRCKILIPVTHQVPGTYHKQSRSFLYLSFVKLIFSSMADHQMGDVVKMHRFMAGD